MQCVETCRGVSSQYLYVVFSHTDKSCDCMKIIPSNLPIYNPVNCLNRNYKVTTKLMSFVLLNSTYLYRCTALLTSMSPRPVTTSTSPRKDNKNIFLIILSPYIWFCWRNFFDTFPFSKWSCGTSIRLEVCTAPASTANRPGTTDTTGIRSLRSSPGLPSCSLTRPPYSPPTLGSKSNSGMVEPGRCCGPPQTTSSASPGRWTPAFIQVNVIQ